MSIPLIILVILIIWALYHLIKGMIKLAISIALVAAIAYVLLNFFGGGWAGFIQMFVQQTP